MHSPPHARSAPTYGWTVAIIAACVLALPACASDAPDSEAIKATICPAGPCHGVGTFVDGACQNPNLPDGTSCSDNNTCATNKACLAGSCVGTPLADGTTCDDQDVCTQVDACHGGVCVGSDPIVCPAADVCHYAGVCDPNLGCQVTSKGPCATGLSVASLRGCPPGDYWTEVTIGGTQTFSLIADTGSSTLAVAESTCTDCTFSGCGASGQGTAPVSPVYTPQGSAKDLNEQSSGTYGDGSGWQGEVFVDTVQGGTPQSPTSPVVSMRFAAINQSSNFFTAASCVLDAPQCTNTQQGIVGLGPAALVASNTDALLPRFAGQANATNAASFQPCNSGGRLRYGGYDPNDISAPAQFVPMIASDYYALSLTDMGAAGVSLGMDMAEINPLIVDTGTTEFLVVDAIFNRVTGAIVGNSNFLRYFPSDFFSAANQSCVTPTVAATSTALDLALPELSLTFTDAGGQAVVLTMPATQSYLMPVPTSDGTVHYCPGIASLGQSSNLSIFGSAFMRGRVVIFDAQGQQIGFAPGIGCAGFATEPAVAGP